MATIQGEQRDTILSIRRALRGRCPNCDRGRLFQTYLRQVDRCSACGEPWGELRADDAPPWLTILIVGHLVAPVALALVKYSRLPDWAISTLLVAASLALCLLVLPRAKALFLAAIWGFPRALVLRLCRAGSADQLGDRRRGAEARHQVDQDDAAARRLHEVGPHHLIDGVVGTLDQHVGAHRLDQGSAGCPR